MGPVVADEICPRLFMGPIPPPGRYVASAGFSTLVLCAKRSEYKTVYMLDKATPVERAFSGIELVVVDLDDDFDNPLTEQEFIRAQTASESVKWTVRAHKNVLVTCMMGRNRSGLVTALALRHLCDWSGSKAMDHVRQMRNERHVLGNPQFAELLMRLPAPSTPRASRIQPAQRIRRFDRYRRSLP